MINKVFINGYQKLILRLYLARLSVKISSRGVCQPINKTFFQRSCPLRNRQPCRYSILLVVKERPKADHLLVGFNIFSVSRTEQTSF